jgi:hypothetical protein
VSGSEGAGAAEGSAVPNAAAIPAGGPAASEHEQKKHFQLSAFNLHNFFGSLFFIVVHTPA